MGSTTVGDLKFGTSFSIDFGEFSKGEASLVLDGEGGELVRGLSKLGGKRVRGEGAADAKTAMAMKSHSDAERRRRERINSHLDKMRNMIPHTEKLDKAALLAEVIDHVKKLKAKASEASKGYTIPFDADEVRVEIEGDVMKNGSFLVKASLCCEDRPELLADLKETLQSLRLRTVRAEISSLGGRIKHVLVLISEETSTEVERHLFMASIHQALKCILDRVNLQAELLPRLSCLNKRQKISAVESSGSCF